ncbi:MAG: hypothetical protein V2A67_08080 [Bacteroidota bacterium]
MKRMTIILVFLSLVATGYPQSKQAMNARIDQLTSQVAEQNGNILVLIEQNKTLADQMQSLVAKVSSLETLVQALSKKPTVEIMDISNTSTPPTSTATQSNDQPKRCKAITAAGTQCSRNAQTGSDYCWQHQGTSVNSKSSSVPTSSGTYNGKTIYTGPRGGKYYINKNGNKTYIKK